MGITEVLSAHRVTSGARISMISGKSGRTLWAIRGSIRTGFGLHVSPIGDIDGDRRPDTLVLADYGQVDLRSGVSGKLIRSFKR